ncbi:hypothetical protein DSO57_1016476 [Entomophthora muscae]|uniref:Uncharacterized protein n=1 Tax=Entomophthora muscae TaxID=34485 RepID=A0ACC2STU5_9FUNG|nr:hypothetical protein DSO57_1016476 [Entomophthora muscae]
MIYNLTICSSWPPRVIIFPSMLEIPPTPPANCASFPGLHIGAGQPGCAPYWELASLATAVNYLVKIAPIVYLLFQARPTLPTGAQPDSVMGHDTYPQDILSSSIPSY